MLRSSVNWNLAKTYFLPGLHNCPLVALTFNYLISPPKPKMYICSRVLLICLCFNQLNSDSFNVFVLNSFKYYLGQFSPTFNLLPTMESTFKQKLGNNFVNWVLRNEWTEIKTVFFIQFTSTTANIFWWSRDFTRIIRRLVKSLCWLKNDYLLKKRCKLFDYSAILNRKWGGYCLKKAIFWAEQILVFEKSSFRLKLLPFS